MYKNSLASRKQSAKVRAVLWGFFFGFTFENHFVNFSSLLGIFYYLKSEFVSHYLEERQL